MIRLTPLPIVALAICLIGAPSALAQRDGPQALQKGPWTPELEANRQPVLVVRPDGPTTGTLVDSLRRRFIEGEEPAFLTPPPDQAYPSDPRGGYGR